MTCQSDNQGSILNLAFVLLLVVIIGTVATGHCQELPDAPQPQITDYTVHNGAVTFAAPKSNTRHPLRLLGLVAVNTYAVLGDLKDIRTSEELFHQYGYIEANTFLVGTRPAPGAYYRRDFGLLLPLLNVPSIIGYIKRNPTLYYTGLTAPAVFGTIHLKQGFDNEATLHKLDGQ
jgi:hypothetical protein